MKILYLPSSLSQQRQFEKKNVNIYPVLMAMEATKRRNDGEEVYWGETTEKVEKIISEPEGLPFLSLPHADRILTNAFAPSFQRNGNFKYLPGTYIQSASGCSWGKCSFCCENGKPYLVRPVEDVMSELQEIRHMNYKEAFDDSATFPTGDWLDEFCKFRIAVKDPLPLSCNMRIDSKVDYNMLKQANFRMLLYGIESANEATLDKIQKGVKVEDIIPTIKKASEAGLEPHVAVMFGYPWESDEDALRTLTLVHFLLRKGYAKTAQASFFTQRGYDSNGDHRKFVRRLYEVVYYPEFWSQQLKDIKSKDDLKYLWRKIKVGIKEGI